MHDRWAGWRRSQSYTRIPPLGRQPAAAILACYARPPLACMGAAADQQRCKLAGAEDGAHAVAASPICRRNGIDMEPRPSLGGASLPRACASFAEQIVHLA